MYDLVLTNLNIATMAADDTTVGIMRDGIIAIEDTRIAYVGPADGLTDNFAKDRRDCAGRWALPGFIDCHTHIVFGGNRVDEFEARLKGATYEDIAAGGGGIAATVRATRSASEEALIKAAIPRLKRLQREGVMTVEIKSGYGLRLEDEVKMLWAAVRAAGEVGLAARVTFLGAHAIPGEYGEDADKYIDEIVNVMIPTLAEENIADAIDAFCEHMAFTPEQVRRVFDAAVSHGFKVKLHADQLSDLGGAGLAAEYNALSADHLEYANEDGIRQMADSGTVAVMLPGAYYSLRQNKRPPVHLFRKHNVPMAVATDANPGSSPVLSIQTVMSMACTLFEMTTDEALRGITINAAKALGISDQYGSLESGKKANILLFDIDHPAELTYWVGGMAPSNIIKSGKIV